MYKKEFAYEALTQMIKKYDLARLKYIEGTSKPTYVITEQEISDIYEKENFQLEFSDKLNIVTQRIYQYYKGYSSIDEIRDMNIDCLIFTDIVLIPSVLENFLLGEYFCRIEHEKLEDFVFLSCELNLNSLNVYFKRRSVENEILVCELIVRSLR